MYELGKKDVLSFVHEDIFGRLIDIMSDKGK